MQKLVRRPSKRLILGKTVEKKNQLLLLSKILKIKRNLKQNHFRRKEFLKISFEVFLWKYSHINANLRGKNKILIRKNVKEK